MISIINSRTPIQNPMGPTTVGAKKWESDRRLIFLKPSICSLNHTGLNKSWFQEHSLMKGA